MEEHLFAEDMAALEIPISRLSRGAEGIFVKPGAISATAARVALGDIRANGTYGPVQLVRQTDHSFIDYEFADVAPRKVREKQ